MPDDAKPEPPKPEAAAEIHDKGGGLHELVRGAWAAALGLAQDVEQEARVVGERLQEVLGAPRAERLTVELRDRYLSGREQLEGRLEEGVRACLSRLRFPRREEVAAMNAHVEGLEARVGALERRDKRR